MGGPADYLAFPRNRYELIRIVEFANKNDIPWMVLEMLATSLFVMVVSVVLLSCLIN